MEMDCVVDIAGLDRTARPGAEPETGLTQNGLVGVDTLVRDAQRTLAAHGQILTGADFARAGQLGERLEAVFEELAETFATLPAVISDGRVWTYQELESRANQFARVLIKQRHIRVGKQICNVPSFMVRQDSEKHIDFAFSSPFGGGRPGRVARKGKGADKKDGEEDED